MFKTKIILCVVLVIIADGLFYKQPIGWTAGLYAGLLLAVLTVTNRHFLPSTSSKIIASLTTTLIISLIDAPQLLTVALFGLGIITLLILQKRKNLNCTLLWLKDVSGFFTQGINQWQRDVQKIKHASKRKTGKQNCTPLRYLVIPGLLTLVFGFLFMQANPIIAHIFDGLEWELILGLLSVWHWLFWFITAVLVWALLRPRFLLCNTIESNAALDLDRWFNQQTIVLSLWLFNGVFALQNALDIVFLWSGETLPNGLSYAEYAHAGAYPLFFTSIISAIYVLITFNEHQPHYQTACSKKLVLVWLAQNVFLQISALNRLLQYIEVYYLTYLRIFALAGIVLTVMGIVLIFVRIYSNRSNRWLINSNALAIAATLYIACFINMDSLIANYNVRHSLEVTGKGISLDLPYLQNLGTEALPALRWFQVNAKYSPAQTIKAGIYITELENDLVNTTTNWRAWTWRQQRQLLHQSEPKQAVRIGDSSWSY